MRTAEATPGAGSGRTGRVSSAVDVVVLWPRPDRVTEEMVIGKAVLGRPEGHRRRHPAKCNQEALDQHGRGLFNSSAAARGIEVQTDPASVRVQSRCLARTRDRVRYSEQPAGGSLRRVVRVFCFRPRTLKRTRVARTGNHGRPQADASPDVWAWMTNTNVCKPMCRRNLCRSDGGVRRRKPVTSGHIWSHLETTVRPKPLAQGTYAARLRGGERPSQRGEIPAQTTASSMRVATRIRGRMRV